MYNHFPHISLVASCRPVAAILREDWASPTGGQPIPSHDLQILSNFFRDDLSGIRIHLSNLPGKFGARACAIGSDLHILPGLYQPATPDGIRLLAHEVCHVIQQRNARVTNPLRRPAYIFDPILEAEARLCEQMVASGRGCKRFVHCSGRTENPEAPVLQCEPIEISASKIDQLIIQGKLKVSNPKQYRWYTETRNDHLYMIQMKEQQYGTIAYLMPNNRSYKYDDGLYQSHQGWDSDQFFDPVRVNPMTRYTIQDAGSINISPINVSYYYDPSDKAGDWYYYNSQSGFFERHDLISNFRNGDLLYGTEHERKKVRGAILERVPQCHYITADRIHAHYHLENNLPAIDTFSNNYTHFLKGYGQVLVGILTEQNRPPSQQIAAKNYHPEAAAQKQTKSGHNVGQGEVKIRRSCKGLMTYLIRNTGQSIHFITENIDVNNNLFTDVEKRHVTKYRLYVYSNFKAYLSGLSIQWPWPNVL